MSRTIDADKLMMHLTDWWYSSFGETETDESKAIRKVMDEVERSLGELAADISTDAEVAYQQGRAAAYKECTKQINKLRQMLEGGTPT